MFPPRADCRGRRPSICFRCIAPPLRLVVALATLFIPALARAEEDVPRAPQAASGTRPSLQEASDEVARMTGVLDAQVETSRLWYWGWSGFYGTVMLGEAVVNATATGASRTSAQVNAFTSVFGLFSTLLAPPPVAFDWQPIASMPENTVEQRAAKSIAIRALFDREVDKERFYHSALNHIIGLAVNAGVSAYMYWELHIGGRALLNLLAGSLVWEANIYTSPNASSRLASQLEGASSFQMQLVPLAMGPFGAGVALKGQF